MATSHALAGESSDARSHRQAFAEATGRSPCNHEADFRSSADHAQLARHLACWVVWLALVGNASAEIIPVLASTDDLDGDGVIAFLDNCPLRPNANQSDFDEDGGGDRCDSDDDDDDIVDPVDNCVLRYNPSQSDSDLDSIGDVCDDGGDEPSYNFPVRANAGGPYLVSELDLDRFAIDASRSYYSLDTFEWDFDSDGVYEVTANHPLVYGLAGFSPQLPGALRRPGSHELRLRVDDDGRFSEDTTTLTVAIAGDLNADHVVDRADLAVMASHYGMPASETAATTGLMGDLTGDDHIGLADLGRMRERLGSRLFVVPLDAAPRSIGANDTLIVKDGGEVGLLFTANSESRVYITGGSVGFGFTAGTGGFVDVSGGTIGGNFRALAGSVVNFTGGTVGSSFKAAAGSTVSLAGGEFLLNGVTPANELVTLSDSDVFTGTLQDGSVFIFTPEAGDEVSAVSLVDAGVPALDTTTQVIDSANSPPGLRGGQTLILQEGGILGDNFAAVNATLRIEGGDVGETLEVAGSEVNISGGGIGRGFRVLADSEVHIVGGTIGENPSAHAGSVVNISGGAVGEFFIVLSGSLVNISGGTIGRQFRAFSGSSVHIRGSEFTLDGEPITGLEQIGNSIIFVDRSSAVLEMVLADGSPWQLPLDSFFATDATLRLTRVPPMAGVATVPEPNSFALAAAGALGILLFVRRQSIWPARQFARQAESVTTSRHPA